MTKAVILAGGRGTRLAPYTTVFPKPLMPIHEQPILEIVLKQLKQYNISEVILAVGYLAELIQAYFGQGEKIGIDITYSREQEPLGTAGPLSLLQDQLTETFLTMNGDILTSLNFAKLLSYHRQNNAMATIAVHERTVNIDYGVIEINDDKTLRDYIEKPQLKYLVSMGINVFEPSVLRFIPPGEPLDIPDLIKVIQKNGGKISCYLSDDYWLDIGRHEDYQRALDEYPSKLNI